MNWSPTILKAQVKTELRTQLKWKYINRKEYSTAKKEDIEDLEIDELQTSNEVFKS